MLSRRLSSPLFVGRTAELHTLVETVACRPSLVYVEGEAGVGKTRLVHEALRESASDTSQPLVSNCFPLREPFPFGPVLDLLRLATDRLPAASRLNPVIGALRPLLPEVGERLPAMLEPLGDPRAEQHRVFRASRELLAAAGRTIAVVEDLHWADDTSRELLRFLMSQPPPELNMVVTFRQEDLPTPGLPLGGAASRSSGVASATIRLAPLDSRDVGSLAAAILGREDISSTFAARLHEQTAGIPLVLEELLRAYQEREEVVAGLEHVTIPTILQEAVAERLTGLLPDARDVVQAAAVLQAPATAEQLAAMTGLTAKPLQAGLSQALRGAVLYELGNGRYGFRHALAQRAVYDLLTGPERQRLHLQAIQALESGPRPLPLHHLVYHCRATGLHQQRVRYAEALADQAASVQDNQVAVDALQDALDAPGLRTPDRIRMTVKLGHAAVNVLSYGKATELLRRLLSDGDLPVGVRGEIRLDLGLLLLNHAGRGVEGREELERAVAELDGRPALAARAMSALGLLAVGSPSSGQHRWLDRAQRAAAEGGDPVIATAVLANQVVKLADVGDPAAWEQAGRLSADAPSAEERQHVARAYCNLAESAVRLGYHERADHYLGLGLPMARESGNAFMVCLAKSTVLQLDWARGRWPGMAHRLHELIDTTSGLQVVAADCRLVLGRLAVARGEWDAATRYLSEAGLAAPQDRAVPAVVTAGGMMARVLLARGQPDAAVRTVEEGLEQVRQYGVWIWAAEIAYIAVEALIRAGRPADAHQVIDDFAADLPRRDAPLAWASVEMCRAIQAELEGRLEDAVMHFERAGDRYERIPRPYEAAQAAEGAGRCLLAGSTPGREAGAVRLTTTVDAFTALDATWDAARCRSVLRDHGVAAPQRRGPKGYGGGLTPREQEVAKLAALGKTNREIADVLFLSPRTVELHAARAQHKLGVDGRERLHEVLDMDARQ